SRCRRRTPHRPRSAPAAARRGTRASARGRRRSAPRPPPGGRMRGRPGWRPAWHGCTPCAGTTAKANPGRRRDARRKRAPTLRPPMQPPSAAIAAALERTFGFTALRPLQREAIEAALAGRDALVVLPTGGGKSLCYQLPPLVTGRMTVVVSPLIALMQDQVDGLRLQGYPAAAVHSNLDGDARAELRERAASGDLKLLF